MGVNGLFTSKPRKLTWRGVLLMAKVQMTPELGFRKLYKETYKSWRSEVDQESSSQRVWFSWFTGKPSKATLKQSQGVCSAGIYSTGSSERLRGIKVYPTVRPSVLAADRELCERWFKWVVHDSIFAGALRVKSFAYAFTYGVTINPHEDVYKVHWALQLLRQLQEHPAKIFVWKHLVDDYGVDPLLAYAVAEMCKGSNKSVYLDSGTQHGDLFDKRLTRIDFLKEGPQWKGVTFAEGHYRDAGGLFKKGEGARLRDLVGKVDMSQFKTAQRAWDKANTKEEASYVNPFTVNSGVDVLPQVAASVLFRKILAGEEV
jgi:hypothetical protein